MPRDVDEAGNFEEFIKGFLEGIGEKGSFEKIMKCIKEGEAIMQKIIDALKKIKTMNPIKIAEGIKELIDAIKQIMAMLKPCMEGFEVLKKLAEAIAHADIKKIVAKIIAHPAEFIKCITHAIEAFAKKDYHGFGKALGELLKLIFLSAQQSETPLVLFMTGFLEGIKEQGGIENLMKCLKGGEEIIHEIVEALKLIKTMNPIKIAEGVKKLIDAIKKLMAMLKPCIDSFPQLKKLVEAIAHAKITEIVKKIIAHPAEFIKHITEAIEGLAKKDYKKCGKGVGGLLYVMFLSMMEVGDPAGDFLKGFLEGISEKGKAEDLAKCSKGVEEILPKILDGLKLLVTMDPKKLMDGVKAIHDTSRDLHKLLAPCLKGFDVLKKLFHNIGKAKVPEVVKKILAGKEEYKKMIEDAIAAYEKKESFGKAYGAFLAKLYA